MNVLEAFAFVGPFSKNLQRENSIRRGAIAQEEDPRVLIIPGIYESKAGGNIFQRRYETPLYRHLPYQATHICIVELSPLLCYICWNG